MSLEYLSNRIGLVVPQLEMQKLWLSLFILIWIHRYTRLIVHCISHWTYKSVPLPLKPTYTHEDVTVVIPTIHPSFDELRSSLLSILACQPHELILVTVQDRAASLQKLADSLGYPNIRVVCTPIASKRLQLCTALPYVSTAITVMADDDVTWPCTILPWILAPFEDGKIGGVGTGQRTVRMPSPFSPFSPHSTHDTLLASFSAFASSWPKLIFDWLGAAYIERRNFEITATHNIDGGTSCMSGRTLACRSEIVTSPDFLYEFQSETWAWTGADRPISLLRADDDNFVTRWLVNHGWSTWVQFEDECEVETTLETSTRFFSQCLRWARSNWRSNWTSLVKERQVWRRQLWCVYALHIATFTSLAVVVDPLLLSLLWLGTSDWDSRNRLRCWWFQFAFMYGFTKVVKLQRLFRRNPWDIIMLLVSIVFGYVHGFIKLYALMTIKTTSWGSRIEGDGQADNSHPAGTHMAPARFPANIPFSNRKGNRHGAMVTLKAPLPFTLRRPVTLA